MYNKIDCIWDCEGVAKFYSMLGFQRGKLVHVRQIPGHGLEFRRVNLKQSLDIWANTMDAAEQLYNGGSYNGSDVAKWLRMAIGAIN
jgi:hypothetical protein